MDVPGIGLVTRSAALDLAVQLVFLANGSLVQASENGKVTSWNTEAEFFKSYAAFVLGEVEFVEYSGD